MFDASLMCEEVDVCGICSWSGGVEEGERERREW